MPSEQLEFDDDSRHRPPTLWEENHGNFLLAVAGGIFLLGALILIYRQTRFVKPRFPDSSAIVPADVTLETDSTALPANASMTITTLGAGNDDGAMMLAIYDSAQTFNQPDQAIIKESLPIKDGQAVWQVRLRDLPASFAVAVFHDENRDGTLDRNRLGIPSERYGFSRDARGLTGPPSYAQAMIERPSAAATIEISIR